MNRLSVANKIHIIPTKMLNDVIFDIKFKYLGFYFVLGFECTISRGTGVRIKHPFSAL